MAKRAPGKPSDAELDILQVLWDHGPSTVRQVWEQVKRERDVGYTTILKQMQLMTQKGLLRPNKAQRSHVYRPVVTENQIRTTLLGQAVRKLFRGSAHQLVIQALSQHRSSPEELAEIRELLDSLQQRGQTEQ
jgi:predicted transcriptional regulator